MKTIIKNLSEFFKSKSPLEEFILSKYPVTTGDVEHWTRVFNHSQYRGL